MCPQRKEILPAEVGTHALIVFLLGPVLNGHRLVVQLSSQLKPRDRNLSQQRSEIFLASLLKYHMSLSFFLSFNLWIML